MVNGHRTASYSTVLTRMSIAYHDVLASQHYSFVRHATVLPEAYYRGKCVRCSNSSKMEPIGSFDQLSLSLKEQDDGPLGRTNGEWLIVLIEHENISVYERGIHKVLAITSVQQQGFTVEQTQAPSMAAVRAIRCQRIASRFIRRKAMHWKAYVNNKVALKPSSWL